MLSRTFYSNLLKWKNNPNKRALLVSGARQIGKTSLIREFGKREYDRMVEINFVENPAARKIFSGSRDAESVHLGLSSFARVPLSDKGRTLIFLDEIQECPDARTSMKFLVEDGRFDYIESGSLLGVTDMRVSSFPVGFEEIQRMYPMDFREFAMANGVSEAVMGHLEESYMTGRPVNAAVHEAMLRLFQHYVITGGMPAVVQEYVDSHDVMRCVSMQKAILDLYRHDITKYAHAGKEKIRDIFDRIPSQLNDKNRRFMLADISKTARLNRFEGSFTWLRDAGVTLPCYNIEEPRLPLRFSEQRTMFKLFLADTGLLCAMGMDGVQFDILNGDLSVNMGSILENLFAQTFASNGFELWYFIRQKYGEVDFIAQQGHKVIPVEVKSGSDYRRHKALDNILAVEEWGMDKGIVFCGGNCAVDGKVHYFPWYLSMFFRNEMPESLVVDGGFDALRQTEVAFD